MISKSKDSTSDLITSCQLNVNGLSQPSLISLSRFIFQRGINIFALQETKSSSLPQYSFKNMLTFHNPHGLGVSLSASKNLQPTEINELNLAVEGIATVWIMITVNNKALLLASVYCPPSTSDKTNISKRIF